MGATPQVASYACPLEFGYKQHSSPNLLEVPTPDSGHCHLELLLQALKAGHQGSMHLMVFDLLSEPPKVFVP